MQTFARWLTALALSFIALNLLLQIFLTAEGLIYAVLGDVPPLKHAFLYHLLAVAVVASGCWQCWHWVYLAWKNCWDKLFHPETESPYPG
jgi:uncharacterized membrane protein HdeD (DUF308 family)